MRDHLGAEAFFDVDTVREQLELRQPLPDGVIPEMLQAPRRIPDFPFKVESSRWRSYEEEVAAARGRFEASGHTFIGMDGKSLLFGDNRASAYEFRH